MTPEQIIDEDCAYCVYNNLATEKTTEERISVIKPFILELSIVVAAGHGRIINKCDVRVEQALEDLESELRTLEQQFEEKKHEHDLEDQQAT
jgi:hypothetical protein